MGSVESKNQQSVKNSVEESVYTRCLGFRLFYDGLCDHEQQHNEKWKDKLKSGGVEAGTLTAITTQKTITVTWDCGVIRDYKPSDTESRRIKILHCAPAGKYSVI